MFVDVLAVVKPVVFNAHAMVEGLPVFLCESELSAMTVSEILRETGHKESFEVIATDGSAAMTAKQTGFLSGRQVSVLFDANDEGSMGAARVALLKKEILPSPKSLEMLNWPCDVEYGFSVLDLRAEFSAYDAYEYILENLAPITPFVGMCLHHTHHIITPMLIVVPSKSREVW